MNNLEHWTEVTRGLYRYVISAKCCYEIHISYWDHNTDILTAKATAYLVGEWTKKDGGSYFERELILLDGTVRTCLKAVVIDDEENNK